MGLTDLIGKIQSTLPDFLLIAVSSADGTPDGENFHVRINDIFVPLDYENPAEKINDLIDLLHSRVVYSSGDAYFEPPKAFVNRDYAKFTGEDLQEILSNLAEAPVALFISKTDWYVDVMGSGAFYPLKKVTASEFINYIQDKYWEGVIE